VVFFLKFDYLSYDDITAIDFDKTWLCLPVGPYEQHGHHLPVSTGIMIARYLCESVCESNKIEKNELVFLEGPVVPFATAPASEGIGSVPHLSPKTFSDGLGELLIQFAGAGFKNILLASHHFDLKFIKSVMNAISACESKFPGINIIEPVSAYYYSGEYNKAITDFIKLKKFSDRKEDELFKIYEHIDFKSEIHADVKETSLMLYLLPRAVKSEKLPHLKPFIINPTAEFLKMNFTYRNMRSPDGYIGTPSKASVYFGESIFKMLRNHLLKVCQNISRGQKPETAIPLHIKAILTVL